MTQIIRVDQVPDELMLGDSTTREHCMDCPFISQSGIYRCLVFRVPLFAKDGELLERTMECRVAGYRGPG